MLAATWGPLQTEEVLDALCWMRSYNIQNPGDTIRVFGGYFGAGHVQVSDEVAGPAGKIMIDANNAYNLNLTKEVLEALADVNLSWPQPQAEERVPACYTRK